MDSITKDNMLKIENMEKESSNWQMEQFIEDLSKEIRCMDKERLNMLMAKRERGNGRTTSI